MPFQYFLCDVFAERPFSGNQLAVFSGADAMSTDTMAAITREFNWSECVFALTKCVPGPRLRIWTSAGELPFAGHPTLGAAVVLAYTGGLSPEGGDLELDIGPVAVQTSDVAAHGGTATMTQFAPVFGRPFSERARLAQALCLREDDLVPEFDAQTVSTGSRHFMVPVRTADAVSRARPDAYTLPQVLAEVGARWAYVFTVDTPQSTVSAHARALRVGREDAATGSAAGALGGYLVHYGLHRPGHLDVEQGVEMGRRSLISVDVSLAGGTVGPVKVGGRVRIWAHGNFEDVS